MPLECHAPHAVGPLDVTYRTALEQVRIDVVTLGVLTDRASGHINHLSETGVITHPYNVQSSTDTPPILA